MSSSIRHIPSANGLPDFRNLGVMLRILLGVNAMGLVAALVLAPDLNRLAATCIELGYRITPPLLVCCALLAGANGLVARLPRGFAQGAVVVLAVLVVGATEDLWRALELTVGGAGEDLRAAVLAAVASGLVLGYFELRRRASDPAANEARLAALTARIRPHFLFNSLNAVLSLIRSDPRQAENALESLAELFRVLMRDPRDMSLLSDEIALCRQYLELEKLRLGERLVVEWDIAEIPADAEIPPLILQPLIENAVYHGIEPAEGGGVLRISLSRREKSFAVEIRNPSTGDNPHTGGNRMALANIRERLALRYDLEARLEIGIEDGFYRVCIELPYRRHG